MTVARAQREFADFLRLKPDLTALAHLKQALHFASEVSASADKAAVNVVETLVARHMRIVRDDMFTALESTRPGARAAKAKFRFFGTALGLFQEYGYGEDKDIVQLVELLESLAFLEKPLSNYTDKDRAVLKRLGERRNK